MNWLRWIVFDQGRLRAGWRFAIFVALFVGFGKGLDIVLARVHFPERVMNWSSLLLNDLVDFVLVAAVAWVMSRISRERFSSYGLPLVSEAGGLLLKGAVWGFIPSVLILIPIYLGGGLKFHGLALHGWELLFYATAWGLAFLSVGFAEEFMFRGCALKTLAEGVGFWPAAIFLSSLFGLAHFLFKSNEGWIDPISVSLYGLFWCFTLRRTGSLWFAVGFHAASDYADMIAFGQPNTGNNGLPLPRHLLDIRYQGPEWLTGGPRGTEASLLIFLVLAILFYLFNRAYPARDAQVLAESSRVSATA